MKLSVRSGLAHLAIALLITSAAAVSQANFSWIPFMGTYSATATETYLQFEGRVGLRSSTVPTEAAAQRQIREQIKYLQSNFRRLRVAAVRSDWKATVTGIQNAGPGLYRITYRFTATAIITNAVNEVEVLLPVNPSTVVTSERQSNCMDNLEGGFFYYWNPRLPTCTMVEGKDYLRLAGYFTRTPNTVQTFPEYNRLFTNGVTRIAILLGKVYPTDGDDPVKGNPWAFPDIQASLESMGFTSQVTSYSPYVAEHTLQTPRGLIAVTVFFGESDIREKNSNSFHHMYKNALENYSVVIYGGHAGTGKNLNLNMIKDASGLTIQPRRDLYQILLLGACFPYAYYVNDYFKLKASAHDPRGTRNLDIMAEGVEGDFQHSAPHVKYLVGAIVDYATKGVATSYQQLLHSDPGFYKALLSVVGDEDNPTSPSQLQ